MNRIPTHLTTLPRLSRSLGRTVALATPTLLMAQYAFVQVAAAATLGGGGGGGGGGDTLGGHMETASQDLTTGFGYVMTIVGYALGGIATLAGIYTIWQHSKNPNGQNRFGYGVASILAGGAFLAASAFATFSSQTVSGAAPTNTGSAAQMTFN